MRTMMQFLVKRTGLVFECFRIVSKRKTLLKLEDLDWDSNRFYT